MGVFLEMLIDDILDDFCDFDCDYCILESDCCPLNWSDDDFQFYLDFMSLFDI